MAALHSTMVNSHGNTVSTTRRDTAEVMAETWDVRITTTLTKDGDYRVVVEDRKTGRTLQTLDGCYPCPQSGGK